MRLAQIETWTLPFAVLLGSWTLGYLARRILIRRLERLSARTTTGLDDTLIAAIRPHVPLWLLLVGAVLAAPLSPLEAGHAALVSRVASALFVLSLSFAAAGLVGRLVERVGQRTGGTFVSTSLTRNVLRVVVLLVGALLVLENLGVDITPLLTALGVGSLAVALALQPTLSNLFAGLHITLAKPVRVGDFVELEGGERGFIVDIGWRSTTVRELSNNVIVVPNARLAEMIVKNYSLPETEQAVVVNVGVSYGSDLAQVERVTCEVAREVLGMTAGAVSGFEPFIRYNAFGDSAIGFSVILRGQTFTDRYLLTHEFLKRLKERYDHEQIEIPFPQRVLHGSMELSGAGAEPKTVPPPGGAPRQGGP